MAITSDDVVLAKAVGAVEAEVDGERVLLSPKDFGYFGLEGSGPAVWELIDGSRQVADIVSALEGEYEAPEGVIRSQTLEYLDALHASGLVEVVN